jgi:hypothetical protein
MAIYLITITYVPAKNAGAQWFTAGLDGSASWALPKGQNVSIKGSANNAPASLNNHECRASGHCFSSRLQ